MEEGNWTKRLAIQIAAQLPENPRDALEVLDYARDLVENWLMEAKRPVQRPFLVPSLVEGTSSPSNSAT